MAKKDDNKGNKGKTTEKEFEGLAKPLSKAMSAGFSALVAASKKRAVEDAASMAKNTKAVQESRDTIKDRMAILETMGLDEKSARHQAQAETAQILRDQKEAILKNNPALTILAPLKLLADGAKAGVKNAAAAVEDKRKNFRLSTALLNGIQGVEKGVVGVASSFGKAVKDKAGKFGGGLTSILKKLLIGGALAAFIAFMNSEYWEKMKKTLVEDIGPALLSLYENILKPIFEIVKDVFIRQFENIKVLFSGVGDAITKFQEGDILGGITTLIGSLGTFFINTIDNLITGVYNLFAGLFGLESTDSVFGSISKFVTDTLKSIKDFFVGIYDGVVGLFTDPVGTLTSMWTGIVGEGGLLDIIFAPIDSAVNWIMGIFGWSTEDGTDFSLRTFITGMVDTVITKIKEIFALGEDLFGDFAMFQFIKQTIDDVISSVKAIFSGDFSAQAFLDLFGSIADLIYAPINLAVNAIKDIFGFGDPDTPFRLSDFVIETFGKIGEFFKSLLDIDVRGLASGILPETVVDFLFGKEVDQSSDEFKSMSALDQAQATGLYDKDLIGNSELNQNLLGGASDAQLQAILDDEDISEDNIKAIKAEQAKRSSAGEFSGSGRFEERNYLLPANKRQGRYQYRGSLEYEEIYASAPFSGRQKIKWSDSKFGDMYGNTNLAPVGSNSGQTVAQATAGAQEAKAAADTTVVVNQNNTGGSGGGDKTVPLPMATKDNSSASLAAAVGAY